ncbi:MAG: Holliday junction branch migration protein RuvA [Ezakiella sp.]|nr:Holliday junction branch migration protein RuvA [Ezakiella sp.]
MYEYFNGKIIDCTDEYVVIDIGGIGYKLEVASSMRTKLRLGEIHMIYAEQIVSENKMGIYGFYNAEEKAMFNILRSVSKIGPKTALGIMGALSISEIVSAVRSDDAKLLSRAPGVGEKSAMRIIIELRDKVKDFDITELPELSSSKADLIDALEGLGYSRYEITKHIAILDLEGLELDEMIKLFLKTMN